MNHECNEIIPEEFILKHLSGNNNLIDKYKKFKKRIEILLDKNKKLCPKPDCDSFLQKSDTIKVTISVSLIPINNFIGDIFI